MTIELPFDIPSMPEDKDITIQLPDHLLLYSAALAKKLPKASIVGDSTFGSCCVDMVTTNHVHTDIILKIGDSCLSKPSSAIPIYYVFEKHSISRQELNASLEEFLKSVEGMVVILTSTGCYHALDLISPDDRIIKSKIYQEYPFTPIEAHSIQGRYFDIPDSVDPSSLSYFYIGSSDGLECSSILMRLSSSKVTIFDPFLNTTVVPRQSAGLMKRFFMVQQAKDAQTIGIVVGTLSVELYLDVIEDVKELVIKAGKKPYLLAVGKPNPAKLGNFLEIDVFCLIACPMNAILDSKEYMKPIVTPYELMVALSDSEWNADRYELDITKVSEQIKQVEVEKSSEPRFSLLTGQFASTNISSDDDDDEVVEGSKALTKKMTGSVAKYSGAFLSKRTYQGLDKDQEVEVKKYEQGRAGIARGYTHEEF